MYSVIIPNMNYKDMERYMKENNIDVRPFFYDVRKHPHLRDIEVIYNPVSTAQYGVMLPSYPSLTKEEQRYIVSNLKRYLELGKHA